MVRGSNESMTLREGVPRRCSVWRRSTTRVQSPATKRKCHTRHTTRERAPRTLWTRVHHAHTCYTTHGCLGLSDALTH